MTDVQVSLPRVNALYQNTPNPFRPETTIRFDLAAEANTRLEVYDVNGRLVRAVVRGRVSAGTHVVSWDGRDDAGRRVSSGVYFYRLTAGNFSATRRMIRLR